ncbi:SMODS domain-containing nucleotidyltransferase [Nitratireductor aquibiodomus]|uniref:SMODS domain-containing nucleotidyltransferase n=1 Tax=Nitratireductor aquibiodomus TaxID=204799 RepID=UPI0012DCAE19|nr:nucleotidyltransferase [Nitratireductor aquibiodomus]
MPGLAPFPLSNVFAPHPWFYVTRRFQHLQGNLALLPADIEDANTKVGGIVSSLNRSFYGESVVSRYLVAGSWGKNTAIRPPSDVDIFFILPNEVFHRFNARTGNKQSQLLQYVRDVVSTTYPQTRIRGDGQVVVVGFNSIEIEIVPAFIAQGGGFIICDANDGGRWKLVNPAGEASALDQSDMAFNGNVRKITRILKQWKRHCNVPIKSFQVEQLVRESLPGMIWGGYQEFWFDWIVRDVFAYMIGRAGGGFYMPGNPGEWINLGDDWKSKAISAYERACKACACERQNLNMAAGSEWQKIFGNAIPETVI